MKFNFCLNTEEEIQVPADRLFDQQEEPEHRYGFIIEKNRKNSEKMRIAELNSGFDTVYWYRDREITQIKSDEYGCYIASTEAGRIPLTFAAQVEKEGNYQVVITLYASVEVTEAYVFLGPRRLAFVGSIPSGEIWRETFFTNVCPIIPRGFLEQMPNQTITITIMGEGLHLKQVEITPATCKTIYIAGDSTVTDQSADYPYYPHNSYGGWGQMLSCYLGKDVAISNHAHSGLTTESFRSEGHYQILLDRIRPDDICLFQFGHNDQKLSNLMSNGGYRDNMIRYIKEIKQKQAIPVLVTPLARNTWKGNEETYNDLLFEYAVECKKIADEEEIVLVDLHQKSMDFVKHLGREKVKTYFFPSDYTHSNDYGAYLFAKYVVADLKEQGVVSNYEIRNEWEWNPPKVLHGISPPEELIHMKNPNEQKLFENLERPEDILTRVEALELVITAMHFFPTNVYNDVFDDIVGHEIFAGTVECAWQNGLIPESMITDHRFHPNQAITGSEFLEIATNGYRSRSGSAKINIPFDRLKNCTDITRKTAADICIQLHI